MEIFLLLLLAEEIITGGAVTATILGGAAGGVSGAARSVSASTRQWYSGHRQRLSGSLLGRALLWAESAAIGLVTGTVRGVREGTGPGVRRAHEIRRSGRQKVFAHLRQTWVKFKKLREQLADKRRRQQASAAGSDTTNDTDSDARQDDDDEETKPWWRRKNKEPLKPTDEDPEQSEKTDEEPVEETAEEPSDTPELVGDEEGEPIVSAEEMSAEAAGLVPYIKTWDAPPPLLEEAVNSLQMMAAQLTAAVDANHKYNVGGETDAAQALQTAADAIGAAKERVDLVATELHEKYDGAIEHLGPVGSEAAEEFLGAR